MFGDRIDEVIADQADLDSSRDGVPDTTLYPVQDAQGTLLGLVDRDGRVVESYLMDASGRARIHGRDETRPEIALLRYRVGGEGSTLPAWIEVVLSEGVRGQGTGDSGPGSGGATFALKDSSGTSIATTLDASRAGEGVLVFGLGSGLAAGSYSVELSGVEDVAGNFVETFAGTGSITDPAQDVVLATGPRAGHVLAILDGPDGVAIVTNVPIDPANVAGVVTVKKQGEVVASAMQLLGETTLLWIPENPAAWIEGASYEVTLAAGLFDIAGRPITTPTGALTFTHLAQGDAIWTRPSEAPLRQQSAYGNDRFLHGRPYLADLGLSDHRARFYDPETQTFLSPDPLGGIDTANMFEAFLRDPANLVDPLGAWVSDFHYFAVAYIALAVGLTQQEAEEVAWASQHVDDYVKTRPTVENAIANPASVRAFHFPAPDGELVTPANQVALANMERALVTPGLISKGIALHVLADTFAHRDYSLALDLRNVRCFDGPGVAYGHGDCGRRPDVPFLRTTDALQAADWVHDYMSHIALQLGRGRQLDAWAIKQREMEVFSQIADERGRADAWRVAIWNDFGVDVPLDPLPVPAGWQRTFRMRAAEQLEYIRQLESR